MKKHVFVWLRHTTLRIYKKNSKLKTNFFGHFWGWSRDHDFAHISGWGWKFKNRYDDPKSINSGYLQLKYGPNRPSG